VTKILEAAAGAEGGVTLNELVDTLAAPKSSVHGLARGLLATGYLREEGGRYRIGSAVAALLATGPPSLADAARPVMRELNEAIDETVMLGSLVGNSVVYVEAVESSQRIRYSPPLHQRRPLWPTSTGKCFLAYFPDRRRTQYLKANLAAGQVAEAERELDQVREDGYAFNRGETLPDISAAAAPVVVGDQVLACIALAGPSHRLGPKLEDAAVRVSAAATSVAARASAQ
jgi:DNA-binding IclR family transcriptional regulator